MFIIVNVNVTEYMPQKCQIWQIFWLSGVFFQALNSAKTRFRPGLRLGPRWGAYDAPKTPSRLGDTPSPYPFRLSPRRLRRLDLRRLDLGARLDCPNTNS